MVGGLFITGAPDAAPPVELDTAIPTAGLNTRGGGGDYLD